MIPTDPTDLQQLMQQAIARHKAGRLEDAENKYAQLLDITPNNPQLLHLLGLVHQQTNRSRRAAELIQQAIRIKPDFPEALNNLSVCLMDLGRVQEAMDACSASIRLKPDYAAAYANLGNSLREMGRLEESITAYCRSISLQTSAAVTSNLSAALHDSGKIEEAIAAARSAIQIDPQHAEAHRHLGHALKASGQIDAALASYAAAIKLNPNDPLIRSSRLCSLHFSPAFDSASIQKELLEWNDRHARPLLSQIKPHENDRSPNRRLRVGYVSPNFRGHSFAIFIMQILRCHDRKQVEVFAYSDTINPDGITAKLREHIDRWRPITGLTDAEAEAMIRADRIDILVDPTMHLARNRLTLFARKPAPIQVTGMGYPGSTGLGTIDYRLTDPYLDPPGNDDGLYTEKLIRLPETFWCYDPMNDQVEVNDLPAKARGSITFGCMNNIYKINPPVMELFAQVLAAVPGSRLIMLGPSEDGHRRDADATRIEYVGFSPRPEYLCTYHRIDISLDVLPYNGHTSSMDSLWMGVPVVTLAGNTPVGRAGVCMMSNLNLPELIAQSASEYIAIAKALSEDVENLAGLRATLRAKMTASPLMDGPRFARNVECAYRTMWRSWCSRTE